MGQPGAASKIGVQAQKKMQLFQQLEKKCLCTHPHILSQLTWAVLFCIFAYNNNDAYIMNIRENFSTYCHVVIDTEMELKKKHMD